MPDDLPLHRAVIGGDLIGVMKCISSGVDVNIPGRVCIHKNF
jgi:hypothetical protein